MHEIVVNLHMHTPFSDGHGTHAEIARAALSAGLDAVIVTDHNVWVNGPQGYYKDGDRKVLLMTGEEVHDPARTPQKNHLLVFGVRRELAPMAQDTQQLVNSVLQAGGIAFIAHPFDPAAPSVGETDITWVDWGVNGITGIELWNGFSEYKSLIKSKLHAIFYAYNPSRIAQGPSEETLRKWDELLREGRRVVAIGGSDAHALPARLGPLRRTLFPYEYHFRTVNTHILLPRPPSGDANEDSNMIVDALRQGHVFVANDDLAPAHGFRASAHGKSGVVGMGDLLPSEGGVTIQIRLPQRSECVLIKDGKAINTWDNRDTCTHITTEPGVYRVEVYMHKQGKRRGWIFSNPFYVHR
jgi:PHP domain